MELVEVLQTLDSLGTAQNRKIHERHGVAGPQFGVSFGNLRPLAKRVGRDTDLARRLWATGNHDARMLATMIADPAELASEELDAWSADLDNYIVTDAFSALVARSPLAREKADQWAPAVGEWVGAAGWNVLAGIALRDPDLPDDYLASRVDLIEAEIHRRPNRTRHSMNQALISIGVRNDPLRRRAEEAAERIGKVEVDHGETGCRTPDALTYIRKTVAHRRGKAEAKAAARERGATTPASKARKAAKRKTTRKTGKTGKAAAKAVARKAAGKVAKKAAGKAVKKAAKKGTKAAAARPKRKPTHK